MELNREQGRLLAKKKEQYPVVLYVYIVTRTTEFRNNFIAAVNLFDKLTCAFDQDRYKTVTLIK